jgi:hypothetical protein
VTFFKAVIILDLVGEFSKCAHIGSDVFRLVLNCCPASSQTTDEAGLDLVLNCLSRVAHFPHEITQLVKELIDLAILMFDLFPFHDIKVSTKGLTKTSSYKIEEAGPLALWGVLVEGNPLSLCRMTVDVWVYHLIPALGWSIEKGNDESNFVHISSEGTPIIVELGFDIIDESS